MVQPELLPNADSEEITALGESANEYCNRAIPISRLRGLAEQPCSFDSQRWQEMADLGWGAIALPESRGGFGLGSYGVSGIAEALGKVAAPEPFIETAVVATHLLSFLDQPSISLDAIIDGKEVIGTLLTRGAWQDTVSISATKAKNGYLLQGHCAQVPLGADADTFILPVECEGERIIVVLKRGAVGLTVTPLPLVDKSADGLLELSKVEITPSQVLGSQQDLQVTLNEAMALGALAASAYLLGLSQALLDMTLDHMRTREQFGKPIGSFQALQHRLVDILLSLRLTGAAVDRAAEALNIAHIATPNKAGASHHAPARATYRAVESALQVAREAIQMHGAMGFTEQCDVSLYVQRILVMSARFGNALPSLTDIVRFDVEGSATGDTSQRVLDASDYAAYDDFSGDWNEVADEDFRQIFRQWVQQHYNDSHRHAPAYLRWEENRAWHEKLLTRGWAAPAWPREDGGMGLEPKKMLIYIEELERHGVSRGPDQGIVMLGPILLEYGNEEQRSRFLKPALTGEHIWCQGYSEPNAGSDLASLNTRAVLEGDEFVINGQKTWTTHALDATHMYCLVRTDTDSKPQRGISFLLIDLDQPGVTIRPITNLSGHVDFCEVFLDNVRAPIENLVGEINQGWTIAKALLGHERLFVGSPSLCQHALNQLRDLAAAVGLTKDAVFLEELTRITLDVNDLEALYSEFAALVKEGKPLGADVALLKLGSTETYTRLSEIIFKVAGGSAAINGKQEIAGLGLDVLSHYYAARPAPIYAGSNEIQRNIIAKHILGLPS